MPFELTHQEELAREFAQREIIPRRKELDRKEIEAGFHLAIVPKEEKITRL